MKKGKLTQAALDRLVLRPLRKSKTAGPDALFGEDSARLLPSVMLKSNNSDMENLCAAAAVHEIGGRYDLPVGMVYTQAVNSLAASGARAVSAVQTLMIPEMLADSELKKIAESAGSAASDLGIALVGGSTAVSDAVSRPVLSVTVTGIRSLSGKAAGEKQDVPVPEAGMVSQTSIVMAGTAGLGGTAVLASAAQDELRKRYPLSLVDDAIALRERVSVTRECREAWETQCLAAHDVSEGGVFGALWELAERENVGLHVDLKKIPILQETVEICEYFDLNPYQLFGQGALLVLTDNADELCSRLSEQGQYCAVIGYTTDQKARCIHNGEDIRYLEKPQQDMLWTVRQDRKNYENAEFPKE